MKSLLSVKIRVVSKQKIKFLTFVFGCSKEPSHRDGTLSIHSICFGRDSNIGWGAQRTVSLRQFFEYQQPMFWLRNRELIFNCTLLNVSRGMKMLCLGPYMYVLNWKNPKTTMKQPKTYICIRNTNCCHRLMRSTDG